jgi:hypothetical protein
LRNIGVTVATNPQANIVSRGARHDFDRARVEIAGDRKTHKNSLRF